MPRPRRRQLRFSGLSAVEPAGAATQGDAGLGGLSGRRERRQCRIHRHAPEAAMIRIAISPAAFDAICATLPVGSVAVEAEASGRGERLIWLEDAMADRLGAMQGPGESYSDVILRIAAITGEQP